MLKQDCKVGMVVSFGRPNGEQTLAEVVKLNPAKAKLRTLEVRGNGRPAGEPWNVPYSMMTASSFRERNSTASDVKVVAVSTPLAYNPFDENNGFYELILRCYSSLSPENLTGDGELPHAVVSRRRTELNRKLRGLFIAVGRDVSESEVYAWDGSKREHNFDRSSSHDRSRSWSEVHA